MTSLLIYVISISCGILTTLILVLSHEYVTRFHIDLFHSLRYYTQNSLTNKTPQKLYDYPLMHWIIDSFHRTAAAIPPNRLINALDLKMRQAQFQMTGAEALLIMSLLSSIVTLIFFLLTFNFPLSILAGMMTILTCLTIINVLIRKYRERFTNQLGDCLTTVANALRAGYSFVQAMDLVSKEMKPPINSEFSHVMRDISYGMTLEQALEDMNRRVQSADFNLVVTAVLIQREIGGNLAQVLDTISETINARIRMRREILTITAQGRMSSWVLAGIPIFIAAVELAVNPHYFDEMLESSIGIPILILSVIFEVIGFVIIKKIVNIKVE